MGFWSDYLMGQASRSSAVSGRMNYSDARAGTFQLAGSARRLWGRLSPGVACPANFFPVSQTALCLEAINISRPDNRYLDRISPKSRGGRYVPGSVLMIDRVAEPGRRRRRPRTAHGSFVATS